MRMKANSLSPPFSASSPSGAFAVREIFFFLNNFHPGLSAPAFCSLFKKKKKKKSPRSLRTNKPMKTNNVIQINSSFFLYIYVFCCRLRAPVKSCRERK